METLSQFLSMLGKKEKDLLDVLDNAGEQNLVLTYRTVLEEIRSLVDPKLFVGGDSGKYATITFFGLNELKDKTIMDDFTHVFSTPTEDVFSKDDVIQASKRLISRIFRGIPNLMTRVRILMDIRGQRLDIEE